MMNKALDMNIILACTLCDLYLCNRLFINVQIRCFVEAELCVNEEAALTSSMSLLLHVYLIQLLKAGG